MFSFFKKKLSIADISFIEVDMHSHLLPGIDDGLITIEETVEYAKELQQLGYKKLICTPHILGGVHPNSPQTIFPVLKKVKEAFIENEINIQIEAGAEYMLDDEFELLLKSGEQLLSFGKNYILVEMSYVAPSPFLLQTIFELKKKGLNPIVAHPERYNYYHSTFEKYKDLKDRGCLLQLNLLSLTGYYGPQVKKVAEKLLENQMIDFVGTDMHHQNHLNAVKNFSLSNEVYQLLKEAPLLNKSLLQ
jgi:tyrosine-protein phosphatase YwqE